MIYNCILIDDDVNATKWLEESIKDNPKLKIIAIENNPVIALRKILELKPDLLFLDIEMPRMTGFELLRKVHEANLFPKVIFTTAYNKYAVKAIKAMAFDYLLKPIDLDELNECIQRLLRDKEKRHHFKIPDLSLVEPLTKREQEVLELVVEGKTSYEIAEELYIGKTTADSHRKNILEKTGAKNTAELITWAVSTYYL